MTFRYTLKMEGSASPKRRRAYPSPEMCACKGLIFCWENSTAWFPLDFNSDNKRPDLAGSCFLGYNKSHSDTDHPGQVGTKCFSLLCLNWILLGGKAAVC